MSADNYIYIDRRGKVWDCVASCTCGHKKHCFKCQKSRLVGQGKSLESAIRIAGKADRTGNYEYGVSFGLWCK